VFYVFVSLARMACALLFLSVAFPPLATDAYSFVSNLFFTAVYYCVYVPHRVGVYSAHPSLLWMLFSHLTQALKPPPPLSRRVCTPSINLLLTTFCVAEWLSSS
jgi:hypothetical protein